MILPVWFLRARDWSTAGGVPEEWSALTRKCGKPGFLTAWAENDPYGASIPMPSIINPLNNDEYKKERDFVKLVNHYLKIIIKLVKKGCKFIIKLVL